MRKSSIKCQDDAYNELLKDLFSSYDLKEGKLQFGSDQHEVYFYSLEDKIQFINELFRFSITSENIDMINLRYGLNTGTALTLVELGDLYNVTNEAMRGRIRTCFAKVRHRLNTHLAIERYEKRNTEKKV